MTLLGDIAGLWRYPVKSMGGEACSTLFIGPAGIDGDRRFAFESSDAPVGKPLLRSADRAAMLHSSARHLASGQVVLQTPFAEELPVADPLLLAQLKAPTEPGASLRLLHQERPMTDVRPLSLHSLATEQALAEALGAFDPRRLRSNIILNLAAGMPFAEDQLSGHRLQLGSTARLHLLERIPRCRMVSLAPETALPDTAVLRYLARSHDGRAGIYARTSVSGPVSVGDPVWLVD